MFDVGRALVFAWALLLAIRRRAFLEATFVLIVGYLDTLQVVSGFTVRSDGPMEPATSMILALIGPSALPRGHLPSAVPLGAAIVHWPAITDALGSVLLFIASSRLARRAAALPMREEEIALRLDRLSLALTSCAVFQLLSVLMRLLPHLLGGELGNGRLDW